MRNSIIASIGYAPPRFTNILFPHVLKQKYYVSTQHPQVTKDELCGPHYYTLLLDDSTAFHQLFIETDHNERQEDISFYFIGIDSTTVRDVGVIATILA